VAVHPQRGPSIVVDEVGPTECDICHSHPEKMRVIGASNHLYLCLFCECLAPGSTFLTRRLTPGKGECNELMCKLSS
jgi:hypothetical protein